MKKVLFISKSGEIGGLEKVLIDITALLDRTKYEVTVMTGEYNQEIKNYLPKDIKYSCLFKKRFRGLDRILVHFPSTLLHKIFIKQFYDVEISFQEGYPTKIIAGASKNSRKVCWLHNNPYYYDFNQPFFKNKDALKQSLEKFDQIVAVSNFIAKGYTRYMELNKQIKVVYNSIDLKKIITLSKENINDLDESNDKVFRICYVGRLSEEKQVDLLIESVLSLRVRYENIELNIIGEGHKFNDLYDKVVRANASDYIKFLGYKENPYPYMSRASMLVCCSLTESFCLVVAEAIALGVPVLSTKCGGPEELLENGHYGLLVDNNLEALTNGIAEMINNQEVYNKYKMIDDFHLKKFDKNFIIKQVENIIDEQRS
ncbi:glycosyltransferase [Mesobacillus foraminis]|uniref:glycosyltransferase n=1 Tax=Mesobacillus foraminis TaxID=279826 RepID=UPI000EF47545|nr:glycosyltransferase [Mesobacillus foraminis]